MDLFFSFSRLLSRLDLEFLLFSRPSATFPENLQNLHLSFFSDFLYRFLSLLVHSQALFYAKLAALSLSVAEVGCEALSFDS